MYIRSYLETCNIGDAIQSVALSRLLPAVEAWPGSGADTRPLVVNGWLGRHPFFPGTAVYAGVHVSPYMSEHYGSMAVSVNKPIGCRDPHTLAGLYERGVAADLIGCATLTLPAFTGPRHGELHVDDGAPGCLTNEIARDMSWAAQWTLAIERLDMLRHAALVHTTRLHVLLACLAFGTPVAWRRGGGEARERFSLLESMGVPEGRVNRRDVEPWACRYRSFLARSLGIQVVEHDPVFPA